MTTSPPTDDFDTVLRRALTDVSAATHTPAGLAERLRADVPAGRRPATHLGRNRAVRWALPLLAAAAVVAVAVVANSASGNHHPVRPAHPTSTAPQSTAPPRPKPAPLAAFHAANVYFSDRQHGWALGDGQCPKSTHANCPALLSTTDGGATWTKAALPPNLVSSFDQPSCGDVGHISGPCVDHVMFANTSDGYLWSLRELYLTTDGGRHWKRTPHPNSAWGGAAQVVVAGHTAVRIAQTHYCSEDCVGAVETAPLGSTDWTFNTPAHQQLGVYQSGLATYGNRVYLFAGAAQYDHVGGVYRSAGGGWQLVAREVCLSGSIDLFGGSVSVVAGNGALIADCGGKRSFVRVAAPGSGSFSAPRRLPGRLTDVFAAADEQHILVADVWGTIPHSPDQFRAIFYRTDNGGRSWLRTETLAVSLGGALDDYTGGSIQFASSTFGYVLGGGGQTYYTTTDGGVTWQSHTFAG
jgi:photosystem II stability/assembly factor-like uncharacterized protein